MDLTLAADGRAVVRHLPGVIHHSGRTGLRFQETGGGDVETIHLNVRLHRCAGDVPGVEGAEVSSDRQFPFSRQHGGQFKRRPGAGTEISHVEADILILERFAAGVGVHHADPPPRDRQPAHLQIHRRRTPAGFSSGRRRRLGPGSEAGKIPPAPGTADQPDIGRLQTDVGHPQRPGLDERHPLHGHGQAAGLEKRLASKRGIFGDGDRLDPQPPVQQGQVDPAKGHGPPQHSPQLPLQFRLELIHVHQQNHGHQGCRENAQHDARPLEPAELIAGTLGHQHLPERAGRPCSCPRLRFSVYQVNRRFTMATRPCPGRTRRPSAA